MGGLKLFEFLIGFGGYGLFARDQTSIDRREF